MLDHVPRPARADESPWHNGSLLVTRALPATHKEEHRVSWEIDSADRDDNDVASPHAYLVPCDTRRDTDHCGWKGVAGPSSHHRCRAWEWAVHPRNQEEEEEVLHDSVHRHLHHSRENEAEAFQPFRRRHESCRECLEKHVHTRTDTMEQNHSSLHPHRGEAE
jgi:hypothetical protein